MQADWNYLIDGHIHFPIENTRTFTKCQRAGIATLVISIAHNATKESPWITLHSFTRMSVVKLTWKELFTVENSILYSLYETLLKIANYVRKHKNINPLSGAK